jgi:sterol desaturase/sphingolipid hydroxylase (fatty acid hydroxylase superfamily)
MKLDWMSDVFISQLKIACIAFSIGLALEYALPATKHRSMRALGFNLLTALLFLYLTMLLVPPISSAIEPFRRRVALHIPVQFPDGIVGSAFQTIAFFLTFDFFFYWWHRAQHRLGFLWVQHRFHHQEQYLNVTTVHRYHFSEEIFRAFVIYLPMAVVFDFKPVTVGWAWTMFTLWGYWIHLNVRVDLGELGKWITGPQFHRYHHTAEFGNRNFAAFFSLWDRLFETYRHPDSNVFPQTTGVRNATGGNTLYEAVAYPFMEWGKASVRAVARLVGRRRSAG